MHRERQNLSEVIQRERERKKFNDQGMRAGLLEEAGHEEERAFCPWGTASNKAKKSNIIYREQQIDSFNWAAECVRGSNRK